MRLVRVLGGAICVLLGGCTVPPAEPIHRGAVGIFFGGQVQEVSEIAIRGGSLPKVGYRIDFARQDRPHALHVEVVRPGPAGRRVTEIFDTTVPPTQAHYDGAVALRVPVAWGTWNVRVECDGRALVDRAILFRRAE